MTTVLIGQNDQLQGHYHNRDNEFVTLAGSDAQFDSHSNYSSWYDATYTMSHGKILEPVTDGINGTPRVGNETRSKNITVRYWKRTA